jgi:hypothetical protein
MSDGEPAAAETATGKAATAKAKAEQEPLPPLSDRDFKIYNALADRMDAFVRLSGLPLPCMPCEKAWPSLS